MRDREASPILTKSGDQAHGSAFMHRKPPAGVTFFARPKKVTKEKTPGGRAQRDYAV